MAESAPRVYQLKITLKRTKPPIWRRIQVPEDYTFEDLHLAIQEAMGWWNTHLHQFKIVNPKTGVKDTIGKPDDSGFSFVEYNPVLESEAKIADYFVDPKNKALYEYDFGDGWDHDVVLEKILPAVSGSTYPQCLAGKRACPPENCGGTDGYEELLQILADPNHSEYEERLDWITNECAKDDPFDPSKFDPKSVFEDGWKSMVTLDFLNLF